MVEACSKLAEAWGALATELFWQPFCTLSLRFVHLPWLVKLCALNLSGNLSGASLQHHLVSCQWEEALGLILVGHFSVSFQQPVFADMAFSWQQMVDACPANAQEVACLVDVGKDLLSLRHIRSKLFMCLSQSIFLLLQLIALGFPPLSLLESFLLA